MDTPLRNEVAHALTDATLASTIANNYNLLLNLGPLPDGSVHPEDVRTLRAVGKQIRREGWPG